MVESWPVWLIVGVIALGVVLVLVARKAYKEGCHDGFNHDS